MLISVSGRIFSGKDTIGKIIQILTNFPKLNNEEVIKFLEKEKWMVDKQAFDKVELTYSEFIKLFEGGESKEDFAIYKRTFNKIPYPRVEWECNCGFKHCLNEGFERDYRKDNFKEIRLPTGRCLKCKKEIKTHSLESEEVLQVENDWIKISDDNKPKFDLITEYWLYDGKEVWSDIFTLRMKMGNHKVTHYKEKELKPSPPKY